MKRLVWLLAMAIMLIVPGARAEGLPGETIVNEAMKDSVMKAIGYYEKMLHPGCTPEVIDTKAVGKEGDTIMEEWTVKSCNETLIYPVQLTFISEEKIEFSVSAPLD